MPDGQIRGLDLIQIASHGYFNADVELPFVPDLRPVIDADFKKDDCQTLIPDLTPGMC